MSLEAKVTTNARHDVVIDFWSCPTRRPDHVVETTVKPTTSAEDAREVARKTRSALRYLGIPERR